MDGTWHAIIYWCSTCCNPLVSATLRQRMSTDEIATLVLPPGLPVLVNRMLSCKLVRTNASHVAKRTAPFGDIHIPEFRYHGFNSQALLLAGWFNP
jgi:hypothetical protein